MLQEQEERKDTVKREHLEDKLFYLIYKLNSYILKFFNRVLHNFLIGFLIGFCTTFNRVFNRILHNFFKSCLV